MKKIISSPFFTFCLTLFLTHQVVEKGLNVHFLIIDNYLDNILCFPILLTLRQIEHRFYTKNKKKSLSDLEIILTTIVLSILFEEVLPIFFQSFTKDYFDYIAYFLGAFFFYLFQDKN